MVSSCADKNGKGQQGHTNQSTRDHLKINENTRVICQGFTGKQATIQCSLSIKGGTKFVGGVVPGKGGKTHLNLPVFNTVREAKQKLNPDASVIHVAPRFCTGAIHEAIDSEIPLVVVVTEEIPIHDMVKVKNKLLKQSKTRLVII